MTGRPLRMSEEVKRMEREARAREHAEQKREYLERSRRFSGKQLLEHQVRYYVEEIGKYGSIPEGLTESQMAQVLKMMKEAMA